MFNFVRNNINTLGFVLGTTIISAGTGQIVDSVIANQANQHLVTAQVCDKALEAYRNDGVGDDDLTPPPSRKHIQANVNITAAHENFDSQAKSKQFRNIFAVMTLLASGTTLLGARLDSNKRKNLINLEALKLRQEFLRDQNQGIERTLQNFHEIAAHLGIDFRKELEGCDQNQLGPKDFAQALKASIRKKDLQPSKN